MATVDVVIIGAGAAGLMCALTAGYRGRSVMVIDHANKAGKKILMSGGGRCNFTNMNTTPAHFLSENPHFCISALKRYTPSHFVELVDRHGLEYHEKTPGQLFCDHSSKDLLAILMTECEWAGVDIRLKTSIENISEQKDGFALKTSLGKVECESLVIATGGLSIPTMGATGFGYDIARQFGLEVLPTRAALVPFTLQPHDKEPLAPLSGVSCDVEVHCGKHHFREPMLFTHRGLSGPAMLQISTFWHPGDSLTIDLFPQGGLLDELRAHRHQHPKQALETWLNQKLPKRLVQTLSEKYGWQGAMQQYGDTRLRDIEAALRQWQIKPSGTEGYRTAEVTLGGVDTKHLSSKTMAVTDVPNLYFIGEVMDVTGQLGGFNFQWAWASGVSAGSTV
ncbi:NAD(P)/FAD-dependent oxidoreductase [Pokkaliibacter sp. CJK22405]|uniref:NAD(P)/FAD-dependent oxidoreductase n=1 Tax=Pokkaliibacter sp. CJK22405 TaxID=3384615 RepID=UPI003984A134